MTHILNEKQHYTALHYTITHIVTLQSLTMLLRKYSPTINQLVTPRMLDGLCTARNRFAVTLLKGLLIISGPCDCEIRCGTGQTRF